MSEGSDYLFDRSGAPDPEVQALERLLAPLAHDGRPLPQLPPLPSRRPTPSRRRLPLLLAAAAALFVAFGLWIGSGPAAVELAPGAGEQRVVAAGARELHFGDLATVVLQPGSELTFRRWNEKELLLSLQRGGLEARVAPPPKVVAGFFQIDTPVGRCVDQGCEYVLTLGKDGAAHVRVTKGAVEFVFPSRKVFVPAGATTDVVAGLGPSTPLFRDCSAELRKAVRAFDAAAQTKDPVPARYEALKSIATATKQRPERRDALPLWHLLLDDDEQVRAVAEAALLELVGPPLEGKAVKVPETHWPPEVWLRFLRDNAF
jgi:hypothetical protein